MSFFYCYIFVSLYMNIFVVFSPLAGTHPTVLSPILTDCELAIFQLNLTLWSTACQRTDRLLTVMQTLI